jgi:hypothetical protein
MARGLAHLAVNNDEMDPDERAEFLRELDASLRRRMNEGGQPAAVCRSK